MRAPTMCLIAATAFATVASVQAEPGDYLELQGFERGRALWLENCEGCHGYGIAGAPVPMQPEQWAPRLALGKSVLYRHAIEGFFGPDDTMMPERGGNPELSDSAVMAAVDYMTALAEYYIQHKRK